MNNDILLDDTVQITMNRFAVQGYGTLMEARQLSSVPERVAVDFRSLLCLYQLIFKNPTHSISASFNKTMSYRTFVTDDLK